MTPKAVSPSGRSMYGVDNTVLCRQTRSVSRKLCFGDFSERTDIGASCDMIEIPDMTSPLASQIWQ